MRSPSRHYDPAKGVISNLASRITLPPRVGRNLFALHEKGVGGELCTITHFHAVVDTRIDPECAAGADRDAVGFETAIFLGVGLNNAPRIERAAVPDGNHRLLRDVTAVVEHALANAHAKETPNETFQRG